MPDQYRALTFTELCKICRARADWADIAAGKNPFITAETAKADIEYLMQIAKEREHGSER